MTPELLYEVMEATWPAADLHRVGPWTIREGNGGGQRVSAATAAEAVEPRDIALAEGAMIQLGQEPLFMIRIGDENLDAALAARGYHLHDPVVAYAAPTATLAIPAPDPMTAFALWPPLSIAIDLWAEAGIGPGRLSVMDRVIGPKTTILGRINDRAAGVAFVACHGDQAMLHALEVTPGLRRQGSANNIMRAAAIWAQNQGAKQLSLAVTQSNLTARNLYASLDMEVVGTYHYRKK